MRAKSRLSRVRGMVLGLVCLLVVPAAAASLRDLHGRLRSIHDYAGHGKWLVVMIWASDCSVCNDEAHKYVAFYKARHTKDITVLGVSMDGWARRAAAKDFIRRHHVPFPNLIGRPEAVADMYTRLTEQPWIGTPTFLIYDPRGKLRAQQVGAVPVKLIEDYVARNQKSAGGSGRKRASSARGAVAAH